MNPEMTWMPLLRLPQKKIISRRPRTAHIARKVHNARRIEQGLAAMETVPSFSLYDSKKTAPLPAGSCFMRRLVRAAQSSHGRLALGRIDARTLIAKIATRQGNADMLVKRDPNLPI